MSAHPTPVRSAWYSSGQCALRVWIVIFIMLRILIPRTPAEYQGLAVDLTKAASVAPNSLSLSIDVHLTNTSGPDGVPTLKKDGDEFDLEKGATVPRLSQSKRSSSSNYSESNLKGAKGQQPSTSHSEGTCSVGHDTTPGSHSPLPQGAAESETPKLTGSESNPDLKSSQAQTVIRRRYGRPNVYQILEEEIAASRGTVAVDGEYPVISEPSFLPAFGGSPSSPCARLPLVAIKCPVVRVVNLQSLMTLIPTVSGPDELVSVVRNALCAPFVGPIAVLKGAPTVMLCVEQFRL